MELFILDRGTILYKVIVKICIILDIMDADQKIEDLILLRNLDFIVLPKEYTEKQMVIMLKTFGKLHSRNN